MTSWQKAIKYAAMAFAILLVVGIIGSIVGALSVFSFLFERKSPIGEPQSYTGFGEINELYIDIGAAELNIKRGDVLSVEHNHKDVTVKENGGRLSVIEDSFGLTVYTEAAVINITVPEDITFSTASITTGAGRVYVDSLTCTKLTLDLGAGETVIDELNVGKSADINGGAGKLTVSGGTVWDLDLDMGVGKLELASALCGNSEIDFGIGDAEITLLGDASDYRIDVEKGIGEINVDGKACGSNEIIGNGTNRIEISGGIGKIDVNFHG